jgi:CubicO group peptidase (beta-lactamase class C family)
MSTKETTARRFARLLALGVLLAGCSAPAAQKPGAEVAPPAEAAVATSQAPAARAATEESATTPDDFASAAPEYVQGRVDFDTFSGAVLVAREGQTLFGKGYGLADRDKGTANTPQTRFRLIAVNSQFNTVAVLMLQAQGKLALQDPICTHLPDCPASWEPVTIHHLLHNASGLPGYLNPLYKEGILGTPFAPEDVTPLIRDSPLRFQPGEEIDYFSGGSEQFLLARIVELASDVSYKEFLQQQIFTPLYMNDTGSVDAHADVALEYKDGFSPPTPVEDMSVVRGVMSVYSTVEDLLRWDQALYTDQLVPTELLDQMFADYGRYSDQEDHPYIDFDYAEVYGRTGAGYSWATRERFGRRDFMSWGGTLEVRDLDDVMRVHPWHTFVDYVDRYPDDRVTIIVLSNQGDVNAPAVGTGLAKLLFAVE